MREKHSRYIVLSDLRSNNIPTVMEYIANINFNIISVQQAKTATMYKNKQGKLLTANAAMFFNRICKITSAFCWTYNSECLMHGKHGKY